MDEKKVLLLGGLGVAAIVVFVLLKNAQAQRVAYLNQPGLIYQPSMPLADSGQAALGNIITGLGSGIGNLFAGFGSGGGSLNDPGLEADDETAFPGMDYSYANSNSYASNAPYQSNVSTDRAASDSYSDY